MSSPCPCPACQGKLVYLILFFINIIMKVFVADREVELTTAPSVATEESPVINQVCDCIACS